jgi:transcriptional regulator with XRE-family HTH domain
MKYLVANQWEDLYKEDWLLIENIRDRWFAFINKAFIIFRGDTRRTVADLARELDVSQGLLSQWMQKDGKIPKSQASILKLANYFGEIVYVILEISSPDGSLGNLPPKIATAARLIMEKIAEYEISPDSPEAESFAIEILRQVGYNVKEPDNSESAK